MKRIPISEAKKLAEIAGAHTVVVFAFTDDRFSSVSYGATRAKCDEAARWLDRIADDLKSGALEAPGAIFAGSILQD